MSPAGFEPALPASDRLLTADPRLRPLGHWDGPLVKLYLFNFLKRERVNLTGKLSIAVPELLTLTAAQKVHNESV